MSEVILCCGVGGTGKTTTSAALGVAYARAGRRVVVLTIDPARRLADALGLDTLDNKPQAVEVGGPGQLDAMMLDRKGTWDEVIQRYAPSKEEAEALLANRYYQAVSTRLTGSHEYMAIEKLYELVESGRWDVVIVDTPPTQHALDFFAAPERVSRILDRSAMKLLTQPGRGLMGSATRRAMQLVQRLAGDTVMRDISEFFTLISGLSEGFRERSAAVGQLLKSDQTQYLLITNANAPERNDVLGFLQVLREREHHFRGFLVNRVAPMPRLTRPLKSDRIPYPAHWSEAATDAWSAGLVQLVEEQRALARHHRAAAKKLSRHAGGAPCWLLPDVTEGIRSIEGLASLAPFLPPNPPSSLPD